MSNIQHSEQVNSGIFYIKVGDEKVAELNYRKLSKKEISIDHTYVSSQFEGKGSGKLLVETIVAWAREHKYKILPRCSFAKAVIDKDEALQDVLY